jgi:CRISPR system Cascade subunit CasE
MTPDLFFTRARVRRQVPAAALRELLLPSDDGRRAGTGHRLVWTLFADREDRERDFLWREAAAGVFYLLSRREPLDQHTLFELDPPKRFAPVLAAGDRLSFSLRANATIAKGGAPGVRGKPCDVVMDAIKHVVPGARAPERAKAVQLAGRRWLQAQGARSGFALESGGSEDDVSGTDVHVTSYRTLRVDHAGPTARIGVLDFEGMLTVTEPERFLEALTRGFGRAKAFGCGLMMIRRAS